MPSQRSAFTISERGLSRTLGSATGERIKPVLTRREIRNSFGPTAEVSHAERDRRNSLLRQFD